MTNEERGWIEDARKTLLLTLRELNGIREFAPPAGSSVVQTQRAILGQVDRLSQWKQQTRASFAQHFSQPTVNQLARVPISARHEPTSARLAVDIEAHRTLVDALSEEAERKPSRFLARRLPLPPPDSASQRAKPARPWRFRSLSPLLRSFIVVGFAFLFGILIDHAFLAGDATIAVPDKVTLTWLGKNVPISVWGIAFGFAFGAFLFGVRIGSGQPLVHALSNAPLTDPAQTREPSWKVGRAR